MRITDQIHCIRQEFQVTPEVKRYINIYLILGKERCYLVDSGVAGAAGCIEAYLAALHRRITDIGRIFITHAHPDHIGGARELQRLTGCRIYAPKKELSWIEDITQQFKERPIPNFYKLLPESVTVDEPLEEGAVIEPEEGIRIYAAETAGHSHGSMSYRLNGEAVFIGDAVPVCGDLPIFTDYGKTLESMDKLERLEELKLYCPAWDEVYTRETFADICKNSRTMLARLKAAVRQTDPELPDGEKVREILRQAGMLQYFGNPLIAKSIEACRRADG